MCWCKVHTHMCVHVSIHLFVSFVLSLLLTFSLSLYLCLSLSRSFTLSLFLFFLSLSLSLSSPPSLSHSFSTYTLSPYQGFHADDLQPRLRFGDSIYLLPEGLCRMRFYFLSRKLCSSQRCDSSRGCSYWLRNFCQDGVIWGGYD